jgi:hypothetical protein
VSNTKTRVAQAAIILIWVILTGVIVLFVVGALFYLSRPVPPSTPTSSPTLVPTATQTETATPTASSTPTLTASPTAVATSTSTATRTATATSTQTSTPTLAPPPTATPSPTGTPVPCRDDAAFVSDVTIPPGTVLSPGQTLSKTWRVRNEGNCAWNANYRLILVGGEAMTSSTSVPVPVTAPRAATDFSIAMTVPDSPGIHYGNWQLTGPNGQFGAAFGVIIRVETTPTPLPPGCSGAPVIASFDADLGSIVRGQSSTLSWGRVDNATGASIDQGIGGVASPGSRSVSPIQTTTYTLTATGCGGITTRQVTIVVAPAAVATPSPACLLPTIAFFTASPITIIAGQPSQLSWGAVTNATIATIDPDIGGVASPGNITVTPSKTITYTLAASGCGGTVRKQVTVTVNSR